MASAIFASIIVKFWPMHIRGLHPNGKKEARFLVAFDTPSANLPGLNSSASSPHSSLSWWMKRVGTKSWTAGGMVSFPSFVSL
ncbi:hypothetical protein NL676_023938 [Syzygium grande]|nr:hypothetical protein NL676_023938 [Syzygium grande]